MNNISFIFDAMAARSNAPARNAKLCDIGLVKTTRTVRNLGMLATLLLGSLLVSAAETNSAATARAASQPAKLDFNSFKLIADRNIFDGNRSGQTISSTRSSSPSRSVRITSFTLVGTLISAKGATAFFDGTDGSYQKVLKSGESIAGFEVKSIVPAGVRLLEGTNEMDLRVGNSMRREDQGLWKLSTATMSYASAGGSGNVGSSSFSRSRSNNGNSRGRSSFGGNFGENFGGNESASSSTSSAPLPAAEVNEVLKRLMEKREQEKQ